MYQGYFGLKNAPFSIVPDHRVIYMSDSHREAVAHLLYSLKQSGGFVQLTGEVGTGKTTVSRYILQHLPENVDVALLLNPRVSELELLESICDELNIEYAKESTQKDLIAGLNSYLLKSHSSGRHTVLMIDEAQNLAREVLEQIRLLTNLETSTDKLLQIILIGQPELENILQRHDLRQLSQRIIGRFKLVPLNIKETREYIAYRLAQAGCERSLFTQPATRKIHQLSNGIPRLINVLCDSALMRAYSDNRDKVTRSIVNHISAEVLPAVPERSWFGRVFRFVWLPTLLAAMVAVFFLAGGSDKLSNLLEGHNFDSAKKTVSGDDLIAGESTQSTETEKLSLVPVAQNEEKKSTSNQPNRSNPDNSPRQSDNPNSRFDLVYRLGVPLKNN